MKTMEDVAAPVNAISTAIAAIAAAISVWLSWSGVSQERAAQWSERRLVVCEELDTAASAQIASALDLRASRSFVEAQMLQDTEEFLEWAGSTESLPDECAVPRNDACRTAIADQERRTAQRAAAAHLRFEAARRFRILGPPQVADAEIALSQKLAAVSLTRPSTEAALGAATQALEEFRSSCGTALARFRTPG